MPLPVRAASTVARSLEGHSSQSGAVARTLTPADEAAEAVLGRDPLPVAAGVAMPVLVGAFEVLAPSSGVAVEMLGVPKVLALPESGEAAVAGEPVVAPRLLPAAPNCTEESELPGSAAVVVDPDVAAVVERDAAKLLVGEPTVWARAAGTTQQRQRRARRSTGRYREVDIMGRFRQRSSRSERRICSAVPG